MALELPPEPTVCTHRWRDQEGLHMCAKLAPHGPSHRCCCEAENSNPAEERP